MKSNFGFLVISIFKKIPTFKKINLSKLRRLAAKFEM